MIVIETKLLFLLGSTIVLYLVWGAQKNHFRFGISSPVFLYYIFILFYLYLADFFYWSRRGYYWINIDFSRYIINSYEVLFFSFVVFSVAFTFFLKVFPVNRSDRLQLFELHLSTDVARRIYSLGLKCVLIVPMAIVVTGGSVNIDSTGLSTNIATNSVVSYALSFLNISLCCLIYLFVVNDKKRFLILGVLFLFVVLSLGFRFRLGILLVSLLIAYVYTRKFQIHKYIFMFFFGLLALYAISLFGLIRVAGKGIDLSSLTSSVLLDAEIFNGFFNDSNIFLTLGKTVEERGTILPWRGFSEFFYVLIHPIPRSLWPEKPFFYNDAFDVLTSAAGASSGAAFPLIGSFFNMYGYITVVLFSFVFAGALCYLYSKVLVGSRSSVLSVVGISLVSSWFLYANTRGYLPQIIQDLLFLLLGLYLIKRCERRVARSRLIFRI